MNCPQDGGEGVYIGTLGRTDWFRCRACGWEFSAPAEPVDPEHHHDGGCPANCELGA